MEEEKYKLLCDCIDCLAMKIRRLKTTLNIVVFVLGILSSMVIISLVSK